MREVDPIDVNIIMSQVRADLYAKHDWVPDLSRSGHLLYIKARTEDERVISIMVTKNWDKAVINLHEARGSHFRAHIEPGGCSTDNPATWYFLPSLYTNEGAAERLVKLVERCGDGVWFAGYDIGHAPKCTRCPGQLKCLSLEVPGG